MPTISMFKGIIVRMYFAPSEHAPAHIHVYYGEYQAIFAIPYGELLNGFLPQKQRHMLNKWLLLHQKELISDWALAMNCETLFSIEPLR